MLLRPAFYPSPQHTIRRDYPPYGCAATVDNALAPILDHIRVQGVTAVYYDCAAIYSMPERRIGDDMFYYIARGRGTITVENRRTLVGAGDCVVFRRGVRHSAVADPHDPFDVIALHFTATVFDSIAVPELLCFPDVLPIGTDSAPAALLHEACREYALCPPGHTPGMEALALRLLLCLIRDYGAVGAASIGSLQLADLQRLLPALRAMRAQLDDPLPIARLAAHCGLSEAHFRRVFLRVLGMSPVAYLRRLRIEEACRLLRHTSDTIDAIAARVGYTEPSFFSHTFRRMMGTSPGRYRATPTV